MKKTIIAILLSAIVGPGVGQLYNREKKKGIILILITLTFSFLLAGAILKASFYLLPADVTQVDMDIFLEIRQTLFKKNPLPFYILSLLWFYGIIDAFIGAKKRDSNDQKK